MKITKLGVVMKIDRHGQAKILTVAEIQLLFNEGFTVNPPRDRALFAVYTPRKNSIYLFPGNEIHTRAESHLHRDSGIWLLREACKRVGLEGVSTHSFRRTALTQMSNAGIPLRVIQEISGHRTLDELYKYLEVKLEQVLGAVAFLSMLAPIEPNNSPQTQTSSGVAAPDFELSRYHEANPPSTALNPPPA